MKKIDVYRDFGSVDSKEVDAFEKKSGFIFPVAYKKMISENNGVRPEADCFDFFFDGEKDTRDVSFFGYGFDVPDSVNITKRQIDEPGLCGESLVAIGEAANGDYICFDYRDIERDDCPKVVVVLHDMLGSDGTLLICFVSNSFEDFIDSLYLD